MSIVAVAGSEDSRSRRRAIPDPEVGRDQASHRLAALGLEADVGLESSCRKLGDEEIEHAPSRVDDQRRWPWRWPNRGLADLAPDRGAYRRKSIRPPLCAPSIRPASTTRPTHGRVISGALRFR